MKRTAIFVDAGYLFAQGSVALAGIKQPRTLLVLDAANILAELKQFATTKTTGLQGLLRVYWYDGALGLRPTLEQEQLAQLDDVKVRLGFINSVGQQKRGRFADSHRYYRTSAAWRDMRRSLDVRR